MQKLIELLKLKNQLLQQVYDYMCNNGFEFNETTVDNISQYLEEKQKYIDKLLRLEKNIKAYSEVDRKHKDVLPINKANDKLINDIRELDQINISRMNKLKDELRTSMKNVRNQKKYNGNYNNFGMAMDFGGSRFDTKR